MKRRICIITGSRAEYGILKPLISAVAADAGLELQLVATGMHLSPDHGLSFQEIEKDGFQLEAKVEMRLSDDSGEGIAHSTAEGISGSAEALSKLKPDLCVVLGDRFEILAAVLAALFLRIPVAHLHGGETTEGAFDEAIRHSITKMSHLHFTAAEAYRHRVIQLGENPERVFNVGSLSVDAIHALKLLSRKQLESELDIRFGAKNLLVTYHPETLSASGPAPALSHLFQALDRFKDAHVFFTKPNADTGGRLIASKIDEYVKGRPGAWVFTNLGQRKYLSLAAQADAVVGNSSSGLIEAPVLKRPTVNIGDRQKGRLRASSVIDCDDSSHAIAAAIERALSPEFIKTLEQVRSPYAGDGHVAASIVAELKRAPLAGILVKKFHDVGGPLG